MCKYNKMPYLYFLHHVQPQHDLLAVLVDVALIVGIGRPETKMEIEEK